jgi:hypothetical protein
MPFLRSGKNIVSEPIKKKKKQPIEEVVPEASVQEVQVVEPVPAPEASVEPVKEVTTVLEQVKEVVTEVAAVLEEVKEVVTEVNDIVKEVKEVEEFIEIKDVPVVNQTSKKKGYSCIIC